MDPATEATVRRRFGYIFEGSGNYPAIAGTEDWRQAASGWLNSRFVLNGAIDAERPPIAMPGPANDPILREIDSKPNLLGAKPKPPTS